MSWLTAVDARLRALIEGSYPAVPVTGRSVPSGTFTRAVYKGDPSDLEWPGIGFHRSYALTYVATRERGGDPPNSHAGAQRKAAVFELALNYQASPDAPIAGSTVSASIEAASLLGHSDHEMIAQAFRYPEFWGGTSPSIVQIRPEGDVQSSVIIPRRRLQVTARWAVTLSYAPGAVWA